MTEGHPALERSSLPRDRGARRRLLAQSAARIVATTVLLLLIYSLTPIPGTGAATAVGLVGGVAAFVAVLVWQVRAIVRAEHPELRALEAVAVALLVLIVVFAFTYLSLADSNHASFSEHLSRVAAFYFTVSTFSTVGFGDIAARSDAARIVVTLQMVLDLAIIAGAARLLIVAVRVGLARKDEG